MKIDVFILQKKCMYPILRILMDSLYVRLLITGLFQFCTYYLVTPELSRTILRQIVNILRKNTL